jgi:hypothetical protein
MASFAIPLMLGALLAAADGPRSAEGELVVRVQPWNAALEGTAVFVQAEAGSRVVALDRLGVARIPALAEGEYRIELPRSTARIVCRWSPKCAPVRVRRGQATEAVIHLYQPASMSSSDVPTRGS